jgi:hypothetical protein
MIPHEEHMHGEENHCGHHHVHGAVDPSLVATRKGISTVDTSIATIDGVLRAFTML